MTVRRDGGVLRCEVSDDAAAAPAGWGTGIVGLRAKAGRPAGRASLSSRRAGHGRLGRAAALR